MDTDQYELNAKKGFLAGRINTPCGGSFSSRETICFALFPSVSIGFHPWFN